METEGQPNNVARVLQDLLDGPDQTIDLQGRRWDIDRLSIGPEHSGKRLANGSLHLVRQTAIPQFAMVEIVQGDRWYRNGKLVDIPAGDIDFTFEGVHCYGGFAVDFGLQAHNEAVANSLDLGINLIGTHTFPARRLEFRGSSFHDAGKSGFAGSTKELIAKDHYAHRVAKHVFGIRGGGGRYVDIQQLFTRNCGNVIDFSNPNKDFLDASNPDVGMMKWVTAIDCRGHTKIASRNWDVAIENYDARNSDVVTLNLQPAFDVAYRCLGVRISNFRAVNFPTWPIGTLSDPDFKHGEFLVDELYAENCLHLAKVQQRMEMSDAILRRGYSFYRSGMPIVERNIEAISAATAAEWASVYRQINDLYREFNERNGTAYKASYTLPKPIAQLV